MSKYSADAHEVQMKILRELLLSDSSAHKTLVSASGLSSDHADFHIKQLVSNGFVEHIPKTYGEYRLTRSGKEYANRMDTDDSVIEKQPKLSVLLDIVNDEGLVLYQERIKQPYYGYWGRPTGKISWGETTIEAAKRELYEETGLEADLTVEGIYHKLDYDNDGKLLEAKYFILVSGKNPRGKLIDKTDGQRNVWMSEEDFAKKERSFGNLDDIKHLIDSDGHFFAEKKYTYPSEDY